MKVVIKYCLASMPTQIETLPTKVLKKYGNFSGTKSQNKPDILFVIKNSPESPAIELGEILLT